MEPYNKNKPTVSWKDAPKDKSELLERLQEAGVPFTAALKYFYDNPEGPASETLNLATDETVPFKYQVRSGEATPGSLAEEAVLWFTPVKGPRRMVRRNPDGSFNLLDLGAWKEEKERQLARVANEISTKDPSAPLPALEYRLKSIESKADGFAQIANDPQYPAQQRANANKLMKETLQEAAEIRNEINDRTLDMLDYKGMTREDFYNNYGKSFIKRALEREGVTDVDAIKADIWNTMVDNGFKFPEY